MSKDSKAARAASARAAKSLPAGSKRQSLSLTPEALEIAERLGSTIPGNLNMGTGNLTKGVNRLAQILSQLEALALAWDKSLDDVLELLPYVARAGIRDWSALKLEGRIIAYLAQKAAQGDEQAEELLEEAQTQSVELIEMPVSAGATRLEDSWIV